jgi:capsular exopolysaccharide synthesis family protein
MRVSGRTNLPAYVMEPEANEPVFQPGSASAGTVPGVTDLALFLRILQRQWLLVVGCTGAVVGAVALATLLMKPTYEPWARLEVEPPGYEEFSLDVPQLGGDNAAYLQTQVQNLQSDELALAVVRKLIRAPDSVPEPGQSATHSSTQDVTRLTAGENAALTDFKRRLKVEHDPGSRVISVSVAAHDPEQAARTTNELVTLYAQHLADQRHEAIIESVDWLSQQLQDIRKRMDESNRTVVDFEKTNGFADIDQGRSTFGEMVADLNKQLTQAVADRIQLQSLVNRVRDANADVLPQQRDSSLIQQLTQKLAEVKADLAQARVIYGPNHPNVRRLESQAGELQAQLSQAKNAILDEVRTEYEAARARERIMSSRLNDATRRLSLLAQYNALKREAQANTDLYNTLFSKIKETEISAASKSSNVRVIERSRVLQKPTRPRLMLNLVLGFMAGPVLGIVLAFIREGLDGRICTLEDIRQWDMKLPLSVVPVIPSSANGKTGHRFALSNRKELKCYEPLLLSRPQSAEAEAVRGLCASLILARPNLFPQALLIASSLPGEGKTTVALNLAVALAKQGLACVVDCDLRHSRISSIFGRAFDPGLAEFLTGNIALEQAIFDAPVPNLSVLPCGRALADAFDRIVHPGYMREKLRGLRERFAFIVLDSPPILSYADGRVLSTIVDGVVFVGRSRVTTREAMKRSLELLSHMHSAPILEVVLNAAESDSADYQYYRRAFK